MVLHRIGSGFQWISCFHAFLWFPWPILAIFHIANVFLVGFPFFFNTSGTSRGSTEVQEEKTGLIRLSLDYNDYTE